MTEKEKAESKTRKTQLLKEMQEEQKFWKSSLDTHLKDPCASYSMEEIYQRFFKKLKQDLNIED